jgi:dienelactone hydrolase
MAWFALVALAAPPAAEKLSFDSLARDRATGRPVRIDAWLFRSPADGVATQRRPAVIALHGCGGMYSSNPKRHDALSARNREMAAALVDEGYVVLFPDSLRSRGIEEICTLPAGRRPLTTDDRRLDVQGALAYLQQRPDVVADRIGVVGWSHGGATVLAAINRRDTPVAAWRRQAPEPPYLRAAAAFYPGCAAAERPRAGYALAAPLALYVGAADDWTPPEPCIRLAARLAAAGEDVAITVYPGAYHGFDGVSSERRRLDVPGGVHPGQGVTVAGDPQARVDSHRRLLAFLRARLAPEQKAGSVPAADPMRLPGNATPGT